MASDYLSDYQQILRNRPLPPPPPQVDDHVRRVEELRKALEFKDQAAAEEELAAYQAEKQTLEAERAERQRLFDAALDGLESLDHDAAWRESQQSFKKILDRFYEQKKSTLFDKYEKAKQQRAAMRKAEEHALDKQIYERIISQRRQSMTTTLSQEKIQPLSTPEVVAPRTPAETPPPLDLVPPTSDRRQSTSNASTNPPDSTSLTLLTSPQHSDVPPHPLAGQSDGATPAMTTSQEVSASVLPPATMNLATIQASQSKALEPISPVDAEDVNIHEALSQAKLLSKRAREDDILLSKSKRVRTKADQIAQKTYGIDANANDVDQTPSAKVVHSRKGSTTSGTTVTESAQDLETQQDSFLQASSNSSLSDMDTGSSGEKLEQHETDANSRTITMKEIRSDKAYGKQRYHFIIQQDGNFWIAKCTEHGVHFGKNVKQGAAKHLNGKAHGLSRHRDQVLRLLGYRITDCTEKLAKENNENFEAKLKNGYKPLNLIQHGKPDHVDVEEKVSSPKVTHQPPEPKKSLKPSTVSRTQPVAGDLWVGYIEREKVHYGVRILPLVADINDPFLLPVGRTPLWKKDTDLQDLPSCYIASGPDDIQWAPGYEDGGPRVEEREYPVFVFDGDETYDWISLANLEPFDLEKKDKKVSRWRHARDEYARLRGYKDYLHMQTDFGGTRTNRRMSEYPVPGKMYATQFKEDDENGVFGVMVLPWLPELAEKCPKAVRSHVDRLMKVQKDDWIPDCYLTTPEPKIIGWAPDYADGGKSVPDRQYPVRWFDSGGHVGWVHGSTLLGFDFENDHCGQDKIQRFSQARMEYAKIFGYKNYADMKAKAGIPETMSRPISAGIVLEPDSESEDSESEPDTECLDKDTSKTEDQAAEQGFEEMDLDADADDQITGSGTSNDDAMPMDLDVNDHQTASGDKASQPGETTVTDSDKAMPMPQTSPATDYATVSVVSTLQPTTEGVDVATAKKMATVPTKTTSQSVPVRSVTDPRAQSVDGPISTGRRASSQHETIQKQPARATSLPAVAPATHVEVAKAQELERMRRAPLRLKKKVPPIGPRPNASWVIVPRVEKPANSPKAVTETSPSARQSPHAFTTAGETTRAAGVPAVSQPQTPSQPPGTATNELEVTTSQPTSSEKTSVVTAPLIANTQFPKPATQTEAFPLRTNPNLALPRRPHVMEPGGYMMTDQAPQTLTQPAVPVLNPQGCAGIPAKPANIKAPALPSKPAAPPKTVGSKARTIDVGARMPVAPMAVMGLPQPGAQIEIPTPTSQLQGQTRRSAPQMPVAPMAVVDLPETQTPKKIPAPTSQGRDQIGKPGLQMPVALMAATGQPEAQTLTSTPASEGPGQSRESGAIQQPSTSLSFLMQTARNALQAAQPTAAHEAGSVAIEGSIPDRGGLSINTSLANSKPPNATLTSSATPSLSALRKQLDSEPLMLCAYSAAATQAQLAENQQTFAAESLFVAIDHSSGVVKSVPGMPIQILIRPREVKRFLVERLDDGTGRATLFMRGDEPVQRLHFANMPGENNKKVLPGWRSCSFLRGYVESFDEGVTVERI
ncbi:hypothetical protein MCOR16_007656 [Pyricularia oryzae]|nr:hypothetical protein MCOR15_009439 [Pyricularia oryzae]KAI6522132.1 hypothetical protein MCOR16_007656 [Pyricularia oryzae]